MADVVNEVRNAVFETLDTYAPLRALARVYDQVPQHLETVGLPYVSFGPVSYDPENVDCIEGGELMLQIDVWSEAPGQAQVSEVAGLVRSALKGFDPILTDNALVDFNHWRTDHIIDGAIKHAAIRFMAIVEESTAS
jgi:hypothetical protein